MASYGPGHLEDRDQRWVGPAAWEDWVVVVEGLGGTIVDEGPLAPDEPVAPGFDEGWLAGLPEATARAAAEALLGRTGRSVAVLAASVSAEVQGTSIHLTSRTARERLDPDRRWSATAQPAESGMDFDGEDGVRDDDLAWMFGEVSAIGALATDPERVPPATALHPSFTPRNVRLMVPTVRARPSTGAARFLAPGLDHRRTGGQVEDLLEQLHLLGRLDCSGRAPDLDRWRDRAARRAGLDAVPAADHPDRPRYDATFDALTTPERARPAASGAVARWRLTTPGRWRCPPEERALLAQLLPALAGAGPLDVEIGDPPAPAPVPAPQPWPTVKLHASGDLLIGRDAGGREVLRARLTEGKAEVLTGAATSDRVVAAWGATRR